MGCFCFESTLNKYNVKPNGIIHIGAHLGEEKMLYSKYNLPNKTIWVEANPELYDQLKDIVKNDIVISEALYNEEKLCNSNITKAENLPNNKQSSSLKELDYHLIAHPNVSVSKIVQIKTMTMINMVTKYGLNINNYDFINIDTQGSELEVLQGFGDLLDNINYIYSEINIKPLYKDIALLNELDSFLDQKGFKRVETEIHQDSGWGQGFYIRK